MQIECMAGDIRTVKSDMIVVNLFEGVTSPGGATGAVDAAVGGALSEAIKAGDFDGKLGETYFLRPSKGTTSPRILVVGLGKKEKFTPDIARQVALPVMKAARKMKLSSVASIVHGAGVGGLSPGTAACFCALGCALSSFEYDLFKEKKGHRVSRFLFVERDEKVFQEVRAGIIRGERLGEAINWGRELVATPPSYLRPDDLAKAAKKIGAGFGKQASAKIQVRVLGVPELEKLGAGGILAVGKGSQAPPRLIEASYRGGAPGAKWTVLVGKGVTFDTGGISLKKPEGMDKMKYDMAGAAAALSTLRACAALGLRKNVAVLAPVVENMPSGSAFRPGDVIRMMSGKTVEVLTTDAEGRLIMADALTYALDKYKPEVMIDLATLTGACVVALGSVNMGVMGNDEALIARIKQASASSGEKAWELPLHEEYSEQIKSEIGDIKNSGGPEAGTITAGCFLKEFVGETPWAHFDIAGCAWIEKEKRGYAPGPSGAPVRLLVEFLSANDGR